MPFVKNDRGCPCTHDCCDKPDVSCPEHECPPDDFCEDCYINACKTCDSSCGCDL